MRLGGDIKGSEHIIKTFLPSLTAGSDGLVPEDLMMLHLSQATNYAYHFSFAESHAELKKWRPVEGIVGRPENLLWDQICCVGDIMRGEGYFRQAKLCFETCLSAPGLPEPKRLLVKSSLADIYCELDSVEGGQSAYLAQAKAMVEPEIERLRLLSRQHVKGFRRLLLSAVEANIKQGCFYDADLGARELLAMYGNLKQPDIVDRLGHVRALIAFARLSPTLEDALKRGRDVLIWNRFYNPVEEEVFTCGVVHLFLCATWYMLGDIDKSRESLWNSMRVFGEKQRQFLIPGVGTYLYHDVLGQIRPTSDILVGNCGYIS